MESEVSDTNYEINKSTDEMTTNEGDYIVKSMGAFGIWQSGVCAITASIRLMTMWNMLSIVFLTPNTNFKCVKFEANASMDVEDSTCYYNCVEYEFSKNIFEDTMVSEFGLICDDAWMGNFTQTILMFGLLVGVSLFGWISDRYGRRKALIMSSVMNITFMTLAPFSPNYCTFNCMRFFIGIASGGTLITGIVYTLEIVGPKYREVAGTIVILPDGFAEASLSAFAYLSPNWRIYLLGYTIISIVTVMFVWLLPETPRWLVSKGKADRAIDVMTKVAVSNKLDASEIRDNVMKELEDINICGTERRRSNYLDLFKTKSLAYKTSAAIVIWTSAGVCYFGINQYVTFIGSDVYIAVMLLGFIQVPLCPLSMIINRVFGRKQATIASLVITGVTMIALMFSPQGHWACTVIGIIGFSASSITFAVIYLYMTELFPTPLRNMAYGLASVGAKIGAMVAPFIATLSPHWIVSLVFAVLPFVASAFCLFLPETKGEKLHDTIN